MSEEEREFIEKLALDNATYNIDAIGYPSRIMLRKDIDTILNIVEKLDKEINRQDNIIKKAIKYIDDLWAFPSGKFDVAINEKDSIQIDGNDYFDYLLQILKGEE